MSIIQNGQTIAGVVSPISTTEPLTDVTDKRFCTDAEKAKIGNALVSNGDGSGLTGIGDCILNVAQTTVQNTATGVNTLISLETVNFDTYGAYNATSGNYKFMIPSSLNNRNLLVITSVGFSANGTGVRVCQIFKNETLIPSPISFVPSSTNNSCGQDVKILKLATNDYIQLFGYQSSGGNLNTVPSYCTMKIYLL